MGHNVTIYMERVRGMDDKDSWEPLDASGVSHIHADLDVPGYADRWTSLIDQRVWHESATSPRAMLYVWGAMSHLAKSARVQRPTGPGPWRNWDVLIADTFGALSAAPLVQGPQAPIPHFGLWHPVFPSFDEDFRKGAEKPNSYAPSLFLATPDYDHRQFSHRLSSVLLGVNTSFSYRSQK